MSLPKDAKVRADKHLAEGEVTGHYHQATAKTATVYEHSRGMILTAPRGTKVVHQEHKTISIPPGEYDRLIVQEFDPFEEEVRAVRD